MNMGKTIRTPYIFWSSVQQEIVQQKTRSSKRLISLDSTEKRERPKVSPRGRNRNRRARKTLL